METKPDPERPLLFVGIDWADREHAVAVSAGDDANCRPATLKQEPEAIAEWVAALHQRYPGHRILIALEQSRGPLMAGLARFPELELYPLNPKQLASYRDAVFPSGAKNDPGDAALLVKFLEHHHRQLRPWQPDAAHTREIAELTELRRKLVDERKRLVLQLKSSLKQYFPLVLKLFPREFHNDLAVDLLRRWPSLERLKRAHPKTLRSFLKEHGVANPDRQTQWIETVRSAVPLTNDRALIEPCAKYVQAVAQQIRDVNAAIRDFDQELLERTAEHPDHELFRALPGAGDALVPRLIAAFGSDRGRYHTAEQLQSYSGIAPITQQSGKSRHVQRRWACPKFLRQTFHEFADQARKWSRWSKAFYRMKRDAGMKHHAAVRALAYKWIRIIFRLWKNKQLYSEETYLKQLIHTNSPIVPYLKNAENH